MPPPVKLPHPWIHGLTKRQQQEIWRDFQALADQFGGTLGSGPAQLPPNVRLVAAGRSGKLATSPDGATWTARTSSFGTSNIYGVCYSPQLRLFVAVGAGGKIATSSSGVVWAQVTSPTSTQINCITWSATLGLFVAGVNDGSVLASVDGTNWTQYTTPFGSTPILAIAWSPELSLFAAVGSPLGVVCTSPDGVNWTSRSGTLGTYPTGVAWNGVLGLFHICGGAGGSSAHGHSSDGITWAAWGTGPTDTAVGPAGFTAASSDVAFLVTGGTNGHYNTSPDGVTWTSRVATVAIPTSFVRSAVLDLYLVVGYTGFGGTGAISTSPDGVTWTARSVPFTNELECACAANVDE